MWFKCRVESFEVNLRENANWSWRTSSRILFKYSCKLWSLLSVSLFLSLSTVIIKRIFCSCLFPSPIWIGIYTSNFFSMHFLLVNMKKFTCIPMLVCSVAVASKLEQTWQRTPGSKKPIHWKTGEECQNGKEWERERERERENGCWMFTLLPGQMHHMEGKKSGWTSLVVCMYGEMHKGFCWSLDRWESLTIVALHPAESNFRAFPVVCPWHTST